MDDFQGWVAEVVEAARVGAVTNPRPAGEGDTALRVLALLSAALAYQHCVCRGVLRIPGDAAASVSDTGAELGARMGAAEVFASGAVDEAMRLPKRRKQ